MVAVGVVSDSTLLLKAKMYAVRGRRSLPHNDVKPGFAAHVADRETGGQRLQSFSTGTARHLVQSGGGVRPALTIPRSRRPGAVVVQCVI